MVDGTVVVHGGGTDTGKSTKWVVFKRATQSFGFAYAAATYKLYIMGIAVYNADIRNVSFNSCFPVFLYYNSGYTVSEIEFTANQFSSTAIGAINVPSSTTLLMAQNSGFQSWKGTSFNIENGITSLTISGNSAWQSCNSLVSFILPNSLNILTILGNNTWINCTSFVRFILSNSLTSLIISGSNTWNGCNSLVSFILPNSLTTLTVSGINNWNGCLLLEYVYIPMPTNSFTLSNSGTFSGCTKLTKIELGNNFDWPIDIRSATALTTANIAEFIFGKLKDNTGLTAKTITISSRYNIGGVDPLTNEQKLIATNKNWTIAYA